MRKFIFALVLLQLIVGLYARCGTKTPSLEEQEEIEKKRVEFVERECSLDESERNPNFKFCDKKEKRAKSDIHVAVHVIYDPNDSDKGYLTDTQVQNQIDALNRDYSSTDFNFVLWHIDRTPNSDWFTGMGDETSLSLQYEIAMTSQLALGLPKVFQIYFVDLNPVGLLGYCYLPWSFDEGSYDHCCINSYTSIPGGDFPYDEGKTLTHEIGHGLGLYHTFQNGCDEPGDYVDDTNKEESEKYGCPAPISTCGDGPDPIDNFMNYVDDRCMDVFTPGQNDRMVEMVSQYRPSLLLTPGDPSEYTPSSAFFNSPFISFLIFTILSLFFYTL